MHQVKRPLAHTTKELELIKKSLDNIKTKVEPIMNKCAERGSNINKYNHTRYLAVYFYFLKRIDGLNKGSAAKESASILWPVKYSESYRPKAIVKWAKEFLECRQLSDHCQGAHVKRLSLLSDNDVKAKVIQMVRATKPELRSLKYFL